MLIISCFIALSETSFSSSTSTKDSSYTSTAPSEKSFSRQDKLDMQLLRSGLSLNLEALKDLLARGANPNKVFKEFDASRNKVIYFTLFTKLFTQLIKKSYSEENLSVLRTLTLSKRFDPRLHDKYYYEFGFYRHGVILLKALENEEYNLFDILIKAGFSDERGFALHYAISDPFYAQGFVSKLIEAGADLNAIHNYIDPRVDPRLQDYFDVNESDSDFEDESGWVDPLEHAYLETRPGFAYQQETLGIISMLKRYPHQKRQAELRQKKVARTILLATRRRNFPRSTELTILNNLFGLVRTNQPARNVIEKYKFSQKPQAKVTDPLPLDTSYVKLQAHIRRKIARKKYLEMITPEEEPSSKKVKKAPTQ